MVTVSFQLIKSSRKEGNMHLASRQLLCHFDKVFSALGTLKNMDNGRKPFNILLETITNQSTTATAAIWSVDNTDALLELSKLAHRYVELKRSCHCIKRSYSNYINEILRVSVIIIRNWLSKSVR
jgi:hypothetical protein